MPPFHEVLPAISGVLREFYRDMLDRMELLQLIMEFFELFWLNVKLRAAPVYCDTRISCFS